MPTLALALVAALVAGGGTVPPPAPLAVARVPDEPGAIVLPDAPTVQAVAADLDADGARDVVRLVAGDEGTLWVEAWAEDDGAWRPMAAPALVVPGQAGQAELAYAGRPVRLLVRSVEGDDRVTVVRQPDFAEPEDPGECCLLLDDLVLSGDTIRLARVAEPTGIADAVHVIDLDGDGTDELLATYSLAPLDDASTPTEARVLRWTDGRFAPPTVTELPVGSGSTAFILGDSDGVAGDEAAFISTSARFHLFRVSLGPDDSLLVEDSGLIVEDAMAVPLGVRRRGLAVLSPTIGVVVLAWTRGQAPFTPTATRPIESARLIGVVDIGGTPRLLVHRTDPDALHALSLPDLEPLPGGAIDPSLAAAALRGGPIDAHVGPLPGGGPDGRGAAIVAGRLLPAPRLGDPAAPTGALPGGRPVGLVGRDRAWLAIHQGAGALAPPAIDPRGGRLDPPTVAPGDAVTIAPLALVETPEGNGGTYEPPIDAGVPLGAGVTGVSRAGLVAEVRAPPGSRVYLSARDPSVAPDIRLVGRDGRLDVRVEPPADATADDPGQVMMTVATPAGHAYVSIWNLRLVEEAPELSARTETSIGSSQVTVAGRAAPYADVEVAGTVVELDEDGRFVTHVELPPWPTAIPITARDPLGNEASLTVSGVGLFDYRALPWIPIALVLVSGIAVALLLRVPHPRVAQRPPGDDAMLEELDPADRL